jgi:hypothetical protein
MIKYYKGYFAINENDGETCFIYDPINGNVNISVGWNEKPEYFLNLLEKSMLEFIKNIDDRI